MSVGLPRLKFVWVFAVLFLVVTACSSGEETPFEGWMLEDLSAEQGFSIRIPHFEVPRGRESQNCYFVRVPDLNNGQDFFVSRVHSASNPGTHHMNVFRVRTIVNLDPEMGAPITLGTHEATLIEGSDDYVHSPCWDSANWADWPLVANSQNSEVDNPYTDWQLPPNVGIRMSPGELLMVQTHYVNAGPQLTPHGGRVGINFHRHSGEDLVEMGSLFATQQHIRICQSNPNPVFSGTCRFPNGHITVEAANGHFHSRGKKFSMYAWDGLSLEQPTDAAHFYTSNEWDHPPMRTGIGKEVPAGGGIWWNCEYQWTPPTTTGCDVVDAKDTEGQGDCCYTFGGNTDVGEHCNVFLYYYPKVDNADVFCN